MRLVARWSLAIVVSAAAFVVTWWVCQEQIRLDEGVSLGVAGAALAVVLTVAAWWAVGEPPGDASPRDGGRKVVQKIRAGRDANVAGGDQTIINYRRPDE